jgi:hypothetical protein
VGSLAYSSKLCTSFLALMLAAYLAPPGNVCPCRGHAAIDGKEMRRCGLMECLLFLQRWEAFLHLSVWDCWRRYFGFRGIVPTPPFLDANKHYMFVVRCSPS